MFKVQITCPDCTYQDNEGCNGGQPWFLEDDGGSVLLFKSKELADDAGFEEVDDSIYQFKVIEVKDTNAS